MTDGDMRIMGFAEGVEVIQPQVTQMILYVLNSSQGGAFVQELVRSPWIKGLVMNPWGRRIGRCFCACHSLMRRTEE